MLQEKKSKLREKVNGKLHRKVRENVSLQEVAEHNSEKSCWVVIDGKVYDVTEYMPSHPGGEGLLLEKAAKDATTAFNEANHSAGAI